MRCRGSTRCRNKKPTYRCYKKVLGLIPFSPINLREFLTSETYLSVGGVWMMHTVIHFE